MPNLSQMSGMGTAARKAAAKPVARQFDTVMPQLFADEPLVPLHHPPMPFRPSIPVDRIRRAVFQVVRERQAKEREAALNGKTTPE